MTDAVKALLAETPVLERASRLAPHRLPVPEAFEDLLPLGGLRPGTTVGITGVGATSLGLALVARSSPQLWTAAVGIPALGLLAASELGVSLDRLMVVPDPGAQYPSVLGSLVDAFDVVLTRPVPSEGRRITARVRERDAVLVALGGWPESDLTIRGTSATWHGIGRGHGHLRSRTLTVTVTGRGAAARPRRAHLWLPDEEGKVSVAGPDVVVPLSRPGKRPGRRPG